MIFCGFLISVCLLSRLLWWYYSTLHGVFSKEWTELTTQTFSHSISDAIHCNREKEKTKTKNMMGQNENQPKNYWGDFLFVNTFPPKSEFDVLDLSVLLRPKAAIILRAAHMHGIIGQLGFRSSPPYLLLVVLPRYMHMAGMTKLSFTMTKARLNGGLSIVSPM